MDEEGVRRVIAENNKNILVQIKDHVGSSISDLKRSNESIASQKMSDIKRLKRDSVPQFDKKSNEEQYKANKAIKDAVEDAQIALERNDVEKTKQALDKGMDLLQESQKLILLADKLQNGWKTVLEYKHHDLADDEEDEKKIYRAESRAARSTKRFTSRPTRQRSNVTSTSTTAQFSASQMPNLFSRVNPQLSSLRSASGLCFACGKPGHCKASCPNLRFNVPSNTSQNSNDLLWTSIWIRTLFMMTATN